MKRFFAQTISLTIAAASLCATLPLGAETVSIPISGTATGSTIADMAVSPAFLDAGNGQVGAQKSISAQLQNTAASNASALHIYAIDIRGEHAADFSSNKAFPFSLASGASADVTVQFSANGEGPRTAYMNIHHDGRSSPRVIFLKGYGTAAATSNLISNWGNNANFGSTTTGQTASIQIQLSNQVSGPNASPITLSAANITGADSASFGNSFSTPLTLQPNGSILLDLTLTSSIAGDKSATLKLQHSGSNSPLTLALSGTITSASQSVAPEFNKTALGNAWPYKPTSLQFGPDDKLYVAEQSGKIHQYSIDREGNNSYKANATDTISLINNIPNHDDNGNVNNNVTERLITGLLVAGNSAAPIIYVTSGDPRIGAGPSGTDLGLDTNSGVLSRIEKIGGQWQKTDLVRGLPRSEENHQPNGMALSADGATLYVTAGGHTNMGAPSNNFATLPEYALSAAILAIDLTAIGNSSYDLPTLDDEDRGGANDQNDPFGGNNGKNMAKLVNGGPVQIHSPGFRNAYDVILTSNGRMYTIDNGPNSGWGGVPSSNCQNDYTDGGNTYGDGLHFISGAGYYGGHPNPTRGNTANTFNNSNPQSPIEGAANPIECGYKIPQSQDGALHVFNSSTNGLSEYTAANFGSAMQGDLLAASFDKSIYRIQLNASGTQVTGIEKLFQNLGIPLDVTSNGPGMAFPGTIWVADYADNKIHIFEPVDY